MNKNNGFTLTPMRRCDLRKQGGFIALISVVVISLILLGTTIALSTTGFLNRFNILEGEAKEISGGLAAACVESARLKIARNSDYDPTAADPNGETIDVGSEECTIVSVTSGVVVSGNYALWAGAAVCTPSLLWNGNDTDVFGNIHSNSVKVDGSNNTVVGIVEWVTSCEKCDDKGIANVSTTPVSIPITFSLADYAPGGSKAVAAGAQYHPYVGQLDTGKMKDEGWYNDATGDVEDGLYYATGDIDLSGHGLKGTVTFVTPGRITLGGSNQNFEPYSGNLLLFADKNVGCGNFAIKIPGSNSSWEGIMYAPGGQIDFSGSDNSTVNGCGFGNTIVISGSDMTFNYNAGFCSAAGPGAGGEHTIHTRGVYKGVTKGATTNYEVVVDSDQDIISWKEF